MRITASHIVDWANKNTKEAQNYLPLLVRRLCFDHESVGKCSFPAGDSTYLPGWDGILDEQRGSAWVPAGNSRWEIGCNNDVTRKANKDYQKRTMQTDAKERGSCTYVFVTPWRWEKKSEWIKSMKERADWANVCAYDADDLEQWLEQSPSVALQFAEDLGLSGSGVTSLSRYWDSWSKQCCPTITAEAFFMGRSDFRDALMKKIEYQLTVKTSHACLAIYADGAEEAMAFVVAAIIAAAGVLRDQALVVTKEEGWRYVEANSQLKVAIAENGAVASNAISREGLLLIIACGRGDLARKQGRDDTVLERPDIYEFEKALVAIGIEEANARRLALNSGHSWTVFRRRMAKNPAISTPSWLKGSQPTSLSAICLLGAWRADNIEDQQVIRRLTERPYEETERELLQLAKLDDSPVLSIGAAWKAKSPLELLFLVGDLITRDQLCRFFSIAKELLSMADPQLELPNEQRWMAQLYGKIHPYSALLRESICDSLVKLSVLCPELPALDTLGIGTQVKKMVSGLLDGADKQRWLSLASFLPFLAEAAPDEFLTAVEGSLQAPERPVSQLIVESSGNSGLEMKCWHAGLLWALESLGWAPDRLMRVTLILAQLSNIGVKENWGNSPHNSLLGVFSVRLPQTAAGLPQRTRAIEGLIAKEENWAFNLLQDLLNDSLLTATRTFRPKWRSDDVGAGNGVTRVEVCGMRDFAKEAILNLSKGNATRIASLLEHTLLRHQADIPRVLELMEPFAGAWATDDERETLRAVLRKTIHWHRNYDNSPEKDLDAWLKPVEESYKRLAPKGLISRYRWLFNDLWPELPGQQLKKGYTEQEGNILEELRVSALTEIYQSQCLEGIESLIVACDCPRTIGFALAKAPWKDEITWTKWFSEKAGDFTPEEKTTEFINGFLIMHSRQVQHEILHETVALAKQEGWSVARLVSFLILGSFEGETWQIARECGVEVHKAYWQKVSPHPCQKEGDLDFVLEALLEAGRPRSALSYCRGVIDKTPINLLKMSLAHFLENEEPGGPKIDLWQLEEILERMEKSGEIEEREIAQFQYALFPALANREEPQAKCLYKLIMSDPLTFTELVCALYKPEHGEDREHNEANVATAERSHAVLDSCRRMPGTKDDGSVDEREFMAFIESARDLSTRADRSAMCDYTLGGILANAPADEDGAWPFSPARKLLDKPELADLREGFLMGTINKRGMSIRSPWEGGDQERKLAAYYRDMAERVQTSHPYVASALRKVAENFECWGKSEDIDAKLRKERF